MELKELIKTRRSTRSFAETEMISEIEIRDLINLANQAPSWKNNQTSRYYVANSPEAVEKVREALPGFNQNSSENAAYIITTFVKDKSGFTNGVADNELSNKWGAYDLGLNNGYFVLAAADMGYDTLIMGIRDANALRKSFNIPKTEQIVSVIAIGKKQDQQVMRERKPVEDLYKML